PGSASGCRPSPRGSGTNGAVLRFVTRGLKRSARRGGCTGAVARRKDQVMVKYIVEHEYTEPLTDERHSEEAKRADPCLARYGVTWKGSWLATDRLKMICEFECETAEQIRNALRSAEVPFARVWQCHKYTP